MMLIIEKPNVMQVFEFRETPAPMIIMAYYSNGNIANAGLIDEQSYVSAWGQILDGLSHLHAKGVVHRDLKPENLLVQKKPFFKVVITDFGLAKVVPNTTLLKTFCGTLQYLAPEVFPGLSNGHGPPVDIWSLGIIVLEWMYGIPTLPTVPTPKGRGTQVPTEMWREWVRTWSDQLLHKLEDENDSQVLDILLRMIEVEASKRWHADRCLAQGFKNGLFKRRVVDGLIVCESDPHHLVLPTADGSDGTKTPTAASPSARIGPEATILSGSMWAGGRSADSPSASNDSSSP